MFASKWHAGRICTNKFQGEISDQTCHLPGENPRKTLHFRPKNWALDTVQVSVCLVGLLFYNNFFAGFQSPLELRAIKRLLGFLLSRQKSFTVLKWEFRVSHFLHRTLCTADTELLSRKNVLIKGTISQELRPMLLYNIQKLFSRPIIASHKIYILLKGQFAIIKKTPLRKLS